MLCNQANYDFCLSHSHFHPEQLHLLRLLTRYVPLPSVEIKDRYSCIFFLIKNAVKSLDDALLSQ